MRSRNFFRTILFAGFALLAFVSMGRNVLAQHLERTMVYAFVRADCAHCKEEKDFLGKLKKEIPSLELSYYDLSEEKNNKLFSLVANQYKLVKGTPITLIYGTLIQGFESAETTGIVFRDLIKKGGVNKNFEEIADGGATVFGGIGASCDADKVCVDKTFLVRLPFTGTQIDVGSMPLIFLSAILGFIDGFNPCAMWVLVMFLVILSQVGSRKRMFQYAGLFIFAEAVMYYLILTVWITAWDFIALNRITLPAVGILAVGSGIYFLYKYISFKPVCSVTSSDQQERLSERVRTLAAKPLTLGVALGILGLAFSVNVFEFACSIGIPQTFTKIIELNATQWIVQQGYMLVYILMYMVDDLIVFGIALYSISKIGSTYTYAKWSSLIGGVLMLALGLLLLFRPEILIF